MASDLVRSGPIEPQTLSELQTFARTCAESGFFGSLNPQQALVIAMAGRDLGFSYTQALRAFHVLKGKPTLSADGMVAACLARGVCEYFRPVEVTETSATWETKRHGCEPVRYSFTMQDAERAGLVSDMYRRHPKRMLSARCKAYLARDVYPELLMGLVTEDEADEIGSKSAARPTAPTRPALVVVEAVVEPSAPSGPVGPSLYERIQAAATVEDLASLWRASASERQSMSIDEQAQVKAVFAERKAAVSAEVTP
jgi:hypothetical protein